MNRACQLVILLILFSSQVIQAQSENFKAIFVYNFTKYIEWPRGSLSSEFVITVLGDGRIVTELESIAKQHQVGAMKIVIKKAATANTISSTQILFVTKDRTNEIAQLIAVCESKHMLLVTEKANSCAMGAAINFVSKNGNLSFEIHRGNIEKLGLKVNSMLLSLGTPVQ